jgi:hypothetical protein
MKEEEIRTAIDGIQGSVLRDALALLLAESGSVQGRSEAQAAQPEYANFAQALLALKRKYTFPELSLFTTEADLVYVQTGDRRILLTNRTEAAAPQPQAAERAAPGAPAVRESEQDSMDNAFEPETKENGRFGRLEM